MSASGGPTGTFDVQCCVVGGGPAGMMAGFLLARAGVRVRVLEKHKDFLRDFRGDTVHPSTLTVLQELGLLERFLQLPHAKIDHLDGWFGKTRVRIADLRRLHTACPYIAFVPQWDFLNFIAAEAARLPTFQLMLETEAEELIDRDGNIRGVRDRTPQAKIEIHAPLTIAADGRHSTLRALAGLKRRDIGAPIDVLWFRVPRAPGQFDEVFTHVAPGKVLVTIDRGEYWQCAYVIPKGGADQVRARGIAAFRADVAATAPGLGDRLAEVKSFDDVKLLTVVIDRLERWSRPGLLCIGDAAHAMSPVGGVGINLAVQDAVAAANLLADKFAGDGPGPADLALVQARREWPMRVIQGFQVGMQNNVLKPVLSGRNQDLRPPLPLRLLDRSAILRGWLAHLIGIGVRPEHVRTPARAT